MQGIGMKQSAPAMKCCGGHGAGGVSRRTRRAKLTVPASFSQGMADYRAGRVVDMETALYEKPSRRAP
jgi:hypothetical protein